MICLGRSSDRPEGLDEEGSDDCRARKDHSLESTATCGHYWRTTLLHNKQALGIKGYSAPSRCPMTALCEG